MHFQIGDDTSVLRNSLDFAKPFAGSILVCVMQVFKFHD